MIFVEVELGIVLVILGLVEGMGPGLHMAQIEGWESIF